MEGTPRLYDTLVQVLSQHQNWVDLRHLKTLAWMLVGLMQSGNISLTAWVPYVHSRAVYAQSRVRRFARWLENDRIDVHALYGPLMQQALAEWGNQLLYLALDTSTCGIPTVWCASRSSIVDGRCRSCGKSWNIPAAVWPMTCIKMYWIRWLSCFPCDVTSSLLRIVVSPTRISWHIWQDWVGIGAFVSKGVFGFIVRESVAAK